MISVMKELKIENKKELTMEESRSIMVDILNEVTSFCDSHAIKYYLSSGTLLGAIRHKGFIPWDDDIDIEMPRPDYERFVGLYSKSGKYSLICPTDKNSFLFHNKVYDEKTIKIEWGVDYKRFKPLGVDIDIFVIDGQPDNYSIFRKITKQNIDLYRRFALVIAPPYSGKRFWLRFFGYLWKYKGKEFFVNKYLKNAKLYSYEESCYVGAAGVFSGFKSRHRKEVYNNRIKVEFEGKHYWAPAGYDEYLTDLFGDYMQLPPVEKRVTHHTNKVYWK
jgi:lipopolysaccharide cholinephosphotransferase